MRGLAAWTPQVVKAAVGVAVFVTFVAMQETQPRFGGAYSTLDARRQHLVDDWVARFAEATGKKIEPAAFYDGIVRLSTKTTFEAITHALMTTALTDASGSQLGDALALIEHADGVRGKVLGAAGDRQFRMYVRLTDGAVDTLARSKQFKRRADNTVFHKGYPINFRGQGGPPSIQVSVALDRRRADVDVDYRASSFPVAMFNGHLSASNSDVRAGNNYDRHTATWTGLQNWWRSFFGVNLPKDEDVQASDANDSGTPRLGNKAVELMTEDFLKAWLLEGDIKAALGYISPRALACLAEDSDEPSTFDRGMAPFVLAHRLKAAHDAVGHHNSLDGLTVGVRLTTPGLRPVNQPHHARFVIYQVPDDVAATFECENQTSPGGPQRASRQYGNYAGATFYVKGPQSPTSVALLWGRDGGYWRIVSWQSEPEGHDDSMPDAAPPAVDAPSRIAADASFVQAAHGFLDSWLVRKDYDAAFSYLSPKAYACYDLVRPPDQPAATSLEDAGRKIRAALERSGSEIGQVGSLDDVILASEPVHPAVRVMEHRYSRTFTLASVPNALADAADCAARSRNEQFTGQEPLEYGRGFGLSMRMRTRAGDPPVLRMLWARENGAWRITAYDVEIP